MWMDTADGPDQRAEDTQSAAWRFFMEISPSILIIYDSLSRRWWWSIRHDIPWLSSVNQISPFSSSEFPIVIVGKSPLSAGLVRKQAPLLYPAAWGRVPSGSSGRWSSGDGRDGAARLYDFEGIHYDHGNKLGFLKAIVGLLCAAKLSVYRSRSTWWGWYCVFDWTSYQILVDEIYFLPYLWYTSVALGK